MGDIRQWQTRVAGNRRRGHRGIEKYSPAEDTPAIADIASDVQLETANAIRRRILQVGADGFARMLLVRLEYRCRCQQPLVEQLDFRSDFYRGILLRPKHRIVRGKTAISVRRGIQLIADRIARRRKSGINGDCRNNFVGQSDVPVKQ